LNLSIPRALKAYLEGRVASGEWETESEYIRELIRQDMERRVAVLEKELLASSRRRRSRVTQAEKSSD
jgi:Arc/MetJ-type ribon-helix-helix transcriptional regulator